MIITGSIIDRNTGTILKNCQVLKFENNILIGEPVLVPDGNFSIDVILNGNAYYLFTCPGYQTVYANTVDILANGSDNFNAFLSPISANMGASILSIGAAGLALLLLANNKKKAMGKLESKDVYPYLIIGGALAVTGVLKKILISLGVLDSKDSTDLDNAATNPGSFWNPAYYKNFSSYTWTIDRAGAETLTEQLKDAFGLFDDCEECAIAVFKQLKTRSQVSYLADVFYQMTGQDLLTFIRGGVWPNDRLSDAQVNEINIFLSHLPTN